MSSYIQLTTIQKEVISETLSLLVDLIECDSIIMIV